MSASSPDSLVIRPAAERDYPVIARLQQQAPEAAQWPVGDYSNYLVLLALRNGEPAGFCCWRQSLPDEAELLNIAVDPGQRRKGIGRALLAALEQVARGEIFLEAAVTNHGAIALYQAHGYDQVGLRKGYYEGGSVDAIVMKKRSCYSPG